MQVADTSQETAATQSMYGIDEPASKEFGSRCLLARRLVESGVRFVQIVSSGWDTHDNIQGSLPRLCRSLDKPVVGLIRDLKARGMLSDTLIVWSSEFGRLPTIEAKSKSPGRDHNPYGFNMWMAGGGVSGGADYGMTDELGYVSTPQGVVSDNAVAAVS